MTSDASRISRRLLDEYRQSGELLLLFDYDGTLAPIVEHPQQATLGARPRRVLERLLRRPGIHVGILSGRRLKDLKAVCGISKVLYAGVCGLEVEINGTRIVHPDTRYLAGVVALLREQLEPAVLQFPGAWIEDKRWAITVHYRQVPQDDISRLLSRIDGALAMVRDQLTFAGAPKAMEIGLRYVWEKGHAVRAFVQSQRVPGRATLYAGDSENDRSAFRAVDSLGGIAVGVGPLPPFGAHYRLPDPAALHAMLGELDEALGSWKPAHRRDPQEYRAMYGFWKSTMPV